VINILLNASLNLTAFVPVKIVVAALSSSKFTSVFRKKAVVMFRYLILSFNGLYFQFDFIFLGFPPHDIIIGSFRWLSILRWRVPVSAAIGERIRRRTKGRFCSENGEVFAHFL